VSPTISRRSDVDIGFFNTPFPERITAQGFSATAQASATNSGTTNSHFSTLYNCSAEL